MKHSKCSLNAVNTSPGNRKFLSSNVATKNGKCLESVSKHVVDVSKWSKNAVGVSDMARKQSRCFKRGREGDTAGASKVFKKTHHVSHTLPGDTAVS